MSRLAGKFAGIVLVAVPDAKFAALVVDLDALAEQGLHVTVERTDEPAEQAAQRLQLELLGANHPGIVADTPFWSGKEEHCENVRARTPTGRNVMTSDIVDASIFLLENPAVNGVNLDVDGGWMMQ